MRPGNFDPRPRPRVILQVREAMILSLLRYATNQMNVPASFQQPEELANDECLRKLRKTGNDHYKSLAHGVSILVAAEVTRLKFLRKSLSGQSLLTSAATFFKGLLSRAQDLFEPIRLLRYYPPLLEAVQETFTRALLHPPRSEERR